MGLKMDDTGSDLVGISARHDGGANGPAIQPGLQLGMARGPSVVRAVALLTQLEHAQCDLGNLIEQFDKLPEAHSPGSDLWQSYDELRAACETICRLHQRWIGG